MINSSTENSPLHQLAPRPLWAQSGDDAGAVIMTTRVRIARNIKGEKFPTRMDTEGRIRVLRKAAQVLAESPHAQDGIFLSLAALTPLEIALLIERRVISPQLARDERPRGVFAWKERDRAVLICEEDHIRITEIACGFAPRAAYENVLPVLENLNRHFEFVHDSDLGYLTACPANVGEAVRTSLFCHLPGLVMTGRIQEIASHAADAGFTIRGFWGEGSEVLGNTFQLTDGPGLSHHVSEMLSRIEALGQEVMEREAIARIDLQSERPALLKDKIARALAVLKSCHVLSGGELLGLISAIRLGLDIGFVEGISRNTISLLTFELGRAFMTWSGCVQDSPDARQVCRADRARSVFASARFVG